MVDPLPNDDDYFYCAICSGEGKPSRHDVPEGMTNNRAFDLHLMQEHDHSPNATNGMATSDNFLKKPAYADGSSFSSGFDR